MKIVKVRNVSFYNQQKEYKIYTDYFEDEKTFSKLLEISYSDFLTKAEHYNASYINFYSCDIRFSRYKDARNFANWMNEKIEDKILLFKLMGKEVDE